MSLTLGEKLQQAREAQGISIREVAENTRISPLYLSSIENNDYKPLPGGIFNKGFIKSFAKYVGVDEQEALADYSKQISQEENLSEEPQTYKPEVLTDDYANSSSLSTYIFAAVIIGLMVFGILAGLRYWQSKPATEEVAKNTNQTAANTSNTGNVNVAAANANTAMPSTNEIKLELKALSEKVSVEATVDGKKASKEIAPETPETYIAQQNLKVRYYRGFFDKVQLTLNGKQIAPPPAGKANGIEVEINKDNITQILQSGQFASAAPPANANAAAPPR